MYKHVFGPVPSRRLGVSLGVDLVTHKICTLDCIYCECGGTTELTLNRKSYVDFNNVLLEIDDYFSKNPKPDYITFSGSGEPTLSSDIGGVINHIKSNYNVPVCVLTNGTLLSDEEVRKDLLQADIVMPSLDACVYDSFKKINRPHNNLDIASYIEGIILFGKEFSGRLDLEIFIIPGINDLNENLEALKKAIHLINPDNVLLNSLDRPGAVKGLKAASNAELLNIQKFFEYENVSVISKGINRKNIASYREDKEEAILGTIYRRPCTIDDLCEILGLHRNDIGKYLDVLVSQNKVEVQTLERGIFYSIKK